MRVHQPEGLTEARGTNKKLARSWKISWLTTITFLFAMSATTAKKGSESTAASTDKKAENVAPNLGALEEDDEFEEFDAEGNRLNWRAFLFYTQRLAWNGEEKDKRGRGWTGAGCWLMR
jgi:hypothetical protein